MLVICIGQLQINTESPLFLHLIVFVMCYCFVNQRALVVVWRNVELKIVPRTNVHTNDHNNIICIKILENTINILYQIGMQ